MFDELARGLGAVKIVLPDGQLATVYKVQPDELLEILESVEAIRGSGRDISTK